MAPNCSLFKTGIIFLNLTRDGLYQQDLFDATDRTRQTCVMEAMDHINKRMGSNTLKYLSTGISEKNSWKTAFNYRSPAYTTNWDQILTVR